MTNRRMKETTRCLWMVTLLHCNDLKQNNDVISDIIITFYKQIQNINVKFEENIEAIFC